MSDEKSCMSRDKLDEFKILTWHTRVWSYSWQN